MSYRYSRLSLLSLGLLAGLSGAMVTATPALAATAGCNKSCVDYLRDNEQARPLTSALIASISDASLRTQFTTYLNASASARSADKAALAAERKGMTRFPAPRGSAKGNLSTMPLNQSAAYYQSDEALKIAQEIMSYQIPSGGWGKNMARTGVVRAKGESYIVDEVDASESGSWRYVGTVDNGATTTELRYLAKVQAARASGAEVAKIQDSIVRGVKYLLAAQYPNGGWPQVYPLAGWYNDAITLNDDAMLRVVKLLNEIGSASNSDFKFLDNATRVSAQQQATKGINWLLNNQVKIGGKLTIWGQQHDMLTQLPTAARAFEMAALSSSESAQITLFLMSLPSPSVQVRRAVYAAADFFNATQIKGQSWSNGKLSSAPNGVLWARFYDLSAYTPDASNVAKRAQVLFGDRPEPHDSSAFGLVFSSITSVSTERLTGYAQYNSTGQNVLNTFATWSQSNPRP
ncbi:MULTISPECIES: pectate lyase [Dickeya]|uniref:Pectate lyase n=1 Tax=Dickeya aquatica TaxID=1401087 RepID=A0A375A8Z8_9GAMM|nr:MULTISPECIES: pectate lyase [Dickeya]SLM62554.1 pectate lyase [Dickeya aquatica]